MGWNNFVDLTMAPDVVFAIGIDGNGNCAYPVALLDPALDELSSFSRGFEIAPLLRESKAPELRFTN